MNRQNANHLHGMNEGQLELVPIQMMDADFQGDELDNGPAQKISSKSLTPIVSDQALNVLNELRIANLLCDAQISVGEQSFNVHRAIMCSCSSYFRVQFTGFNNRAEAGADESRVVHIPGISASIMNCVIEYAYLRRTNITDDNVHELLICADYVGMVGLVKQCKDYLGRTLSPENCVSIMGFARFRFLEDLHQKARNYTLRYFTDVAARNTDILDMNVNDFYSIISDDELNTREEDYVWKLCVKWIDRDPDNRKQHVAHLMTGVRLGLMTPKCFMEEVKEHPYVMQCETAKPLIVDTFKFMYDLDFLNPQAEELTTPPLAMPRLPHEVIFAIGGWSGGTSKGCIETYDTRADRWVTINAEDPAGPRAYHGTAVLGFKIFSIGGYDGVEYFNTCRVFDAVQKRWNEIAPMHCRRCYVSVAELNGMIYAIGGYDGHNRLNTVERYNPSTNQWSIISPMNMQRSDASACTLNGRIYATGGFNGQECLDSAEYYDPLTNLWTRIPNMNHRRSGVSCVAFRDQLYVIGGFNGTSRLSTGERFDPETQSWHFIRQMNHSRSNFGLEIIDDMIFAIGGFNGVSTISHTECYVVETDEWMEATDMNIVRSALSANNVAGLPNKRDYIHKERDRLMEERRQRLMANAMAREDVASPNRTQSMVDNNDADLDDLHDDDDASANEDNDNEELDAVVLPLPAPVPAGANPNRQTENRGPENTRRFRVQLRNHRYGSHHEIRRRS
ncbi:kelch-like protein 10 [Drosophila grimshawi]|uniref:GH13286 n=1 Tax=Drosophila grimshawi TaxID=7222 RepID=B4JQ27_DROGR|nr:kelch-like protein 10 [Drosophila grimshawi]XP_032595513.1 kelch-like protein 10 [Drosophila grimshawi]EDV99007.1 GH13286 [Drosophila grimshawi]